MSVGPEVIACRSYGSGGSGEDDILIDWWEIVGSDGRRELFKIGDRSVI